MRYFYLLFLVLLIAGCSMFEYSPNQISQKEDERNITLKNIRRIQQQVPGDTITFILISDTQRFYDETNAFVEHTNQLEGISFVLHGGDISDFGLMREMRWIHRSLSQLKVPYLTVIGNHDLVGNGEQIYRSMFGELNYSFVYGQFKFIFLNTNCREYKFKGNIPNLDWLEQELNPEVVSSTRRETDNSTSFSQAIVLSHVPPFDSDFDKNKEKQYARILQKCGRVKFSLHGHQHTYRNMKPYHDGITYLAADSMDKRNYLLIKVWNDGYSSKRIFY